MLRGRSAYELDPLDPLTTLNLGYRYKDRAQEVLDRILAQDAPGAISAYHTALVFLGLGRHDEFFEWLERAFTEKSAWMAWFHITASLDPVRDDQRFRDLANRMRFPLKSDASHK